MMTKETKVGLLAGMALILLIGILVSDHLSESREDTTEALVDFAGSSQETMTPPVTPGAPVAPSPDSVLTLGNTPGTTPPVTPTGIAAIDGGKSPIVPLPEEMLFNDGAKQAKGLQPGAAGTSLVPEISAAEAGKLPVNPDGLAVRHESTITELFKETPRLAARGVVDVRKKYYTVKSGDSLYVIAKKMYGDSEKWTLIRDGNEGKVSRNGSVREGVRLVIPPVEEPEAATEVAEAAEDRVVMGAPASNVEVQAPSLFDDTEAPAEPMRRTTVATRSSSGKTVVTVKAGQTLSQIAQQYMGSSRRWPELLEANRKQLRSPEELKVGMKLVIPSGEASEEAAPAPRRSTVVRTASAPRSSVYRVREGDTLSSIARERMGSREKWDDLYRANKSRIDNPDVLVVGTELTLP